MTRPAGRSCRRGALTPRVNTGIMAERAGTPPVNTVRSASPRPPSLGSEKESGTKQGRRTWLAGGPGWPCLMCRVGVHPSATHQVLRSGHRIPWRSRRTLPPPCPALAAPLGGRHLPTARWTRADRLRPAAGSAPNGPGPRRRRVLVPADTGARGAARPARSGVRGEQLRVLRSHAGSLLLRMTVLRSRGGPASVRLPRSCPRGQDSSGLANSR